MLEPGRFEIFEQPFPSALAPVPAFAISTESAGCVEEIGAVHPDYASFDLRSDLQGDIDVLAPDTGCETVRSVVGKFNRLPQSSERHRSQHWTKDLFLGNRGTRMHVGKQSRRIVQSLHRQGRSRLAAGCAFSYTLVYQPADALELHRGNDGTNVDSFIEGRAHAQSLHAGPDLRNQSFSNTFLHQQPRTGAADLSLIEPDAIDEPFDSAVEIGVIEDYKRRLAAQLE